jgi:hypothetical protein
VNAPPGTATREGAFLALALADALSLGLPDPAYITMHPSFARRSATTAVGFQFSDVFGRDPLPDLRAWASHFGVTGDPSKTWRAFDFTHAGVRIHAYANITVPCACGHPGDSHWEIGEPQGTRAGCGIAGCKCKMYGAYEDPAEAADPGYLEDAAAVMDDGETCPDCGQPMAAHATLDMARASAGPQAETVR